ncbi:MAG TPA: DUF2723 domain-containing protein [Chitinophagaceae bacterium]|jgi:hypothetical protein|nr:DUF2723 domain-containing protein [Chitinophagaceae bacterium]
MNFRKVNNITGWAVFLIALGTYFLTREARGSLWDTGEFIASADKLQLPHPPGAPLFVLLGRFFIILFGDNGHTAASAVNFMSALASAATILFLFWSVTHFARKMFVNAGEQLSSSQLFTTMTAGVVGALAYTFSDSFWFSAVEGEVYALSSFFTALVFWAMLKWEHADEQAAGNSFARARSDRWIVFLFFMMGLSIGVHLLNLLSIPAIVMIYYYRRYQVTTKGAIIAFVVGCLITGLVQLAVIQYSMKAAGMFDVFFVNTLGLPFFSGFAVYFLALGGLIAWAMTFKESKFSRTKVIVFFVLFMILSLLPLIMSLGYSDGKFFRVLGILIALGAAYFLKASSLKILKLSLWCYAFMMIGYFMYFTALIRSNANPTIDMNNVDNPINLVYYLSREQYGEAPLLSGPHFAAQYKYGPDGYVELKEGEMKYVKGKDKYIQIGREKKPVYESSDIQFFPRVWDPSNDQYHAEFYADWLGLDRDQQTGKYEAPSYFDNMRWFFEYQMSLMYWRYFMWNFSGKQNDVQGLGNKRDGNWITGISFVDDSMLGDQSKMPDSLKKNKAHNKLYMLPFLFGIVGCIYQFFKKRNDWIVSFLLFFMTGVAVVLYLNQPGNQPRERDYAFVGSFYAFAIWIGLAVVAFVKMARDKADKLGLQNVLIGGGILTFLITFMSGAGLIGMLVATAMFAAIAAGVPFLLRAVSSGGQNEKTLNIVSAVLCVAVPLLMAQQEWDDHDRSRKTTAPDLAKAYLESCAPNAVIFTFGDNDTYPLWYAQEVEGVRPDIRVINNSLLGIDWYINQLRAKTNDADSLDVLWSAEQIEGHNREFLRYRLQGDANEYYDLYDVMKNVLGKPNMDPVTNRDVGFGSFPVARFKVPVDVAAARKNGVVNASDSVLSEMLFEIPEAKLREGLVRSDFIILNIIASNAANGWKRPIYFTSAFGDLGFGQYLRKDGLSYRLVPVITKAPQLKWITDSAMRKSGMGGTQIRDNNIDTMFNNLMTKYEFGGADKKGVYFDEENRRHILNIRALFAEAAGNIADAGRKEDAIKLLDRVEKGIDPANIPYAQTSRYNSHNQTGLLYLEACYKAGKLDLAEKIRQSLRKDLEQQKNYYDYIATSKPKFYNGFEKSEAPINDIMLRVLTLIEMRYAPQTKQTTQGETPTTIDNKAKPDSVVPKPDTPKKPG